MLDILLYQDNALHHVSHVATEFLREKRISTVPHLPYSPDLSHSNFWLFPSVKKELKDHHFSSNESR